jgi:peptidoglycan/xylan/chitin deacetylase (PgdA/CDA1 family)
MWYWVKTPLLVKKIFPNQIWNIPTEDKAVYLTFDDGPYVGVTDEVLKILKQYDAKATFFCIGGNVANNPGLFQKITTEGHSIGNHSMTHQMGWGKSKKIYLKDIQRAEKLINSNLFRPPYGKINFKSNKTLQKKYKIIMWDIIAGDFDEKCSVEQMVKNVVLNLEKGSIIVLHDNKKFQKKNVCCSTTNY